MVWLVRFGNEASKRCASAVTNYVEKCIKSVTRDDTRFNGEPLEYANMADGEIV